LGDFTGIMGVLCGFYPRLGKSHQIAIKFMQWQRQRLLQILVRDSKKYWTSRNNGHPMRLQFFDNLPPALVYKRSSHKEDLAS